MAGISPAEFDQCRELALLPGSLFEFTSRFLPTDQLPPLMALYALEQAVVTIPHTPVDESVKWAKLKWWSEEFSADPASSGRHPVLRALWQSGARTNLDAALLQQLIVDAVVQIDAAPDSDEKIMFERFLTLGATEIQLELALDKIEVNDENLHFLAAATRLFRLISSFAGNYPLETERLPLNMLAKYNVSAAQLEQKLRPAGLEQIIKQLTGNALDWFSKGLSGLKISSKGGAEPIACPHLQLRWAMEKRRLAVIEKDVNGFLDNGKNYGPADAWFAWRFLRGLK